MNPISSEFTSAAWSQLWQVTALIVVVAVVVRFVCRQRPHLAHLLWMLVIVKCLTPPLWSSPAGLFSWAQRSTITTNSQEIDPLMDESLLGFGMAGLVGDVDPSTAVSTSVPLEATTVPYTLSLEMTIGLIWLGGALTLAAFVLVRTVGYCRILRSSEKTDARIETLARKVAHRLGIRQKFRLVITDGGIGPAVFGVFRPVLVIPAALVLGKKDTEVEPILAHELVHLRRGDVALGVLQILAQIVWWFHPLVWWANRETCRQRERCCDEEAITGIRCRPSQYVRCLIDVLELDQQRPVFALPGVHGTQVTTTRLQNIMRRAHQFRCRTPRADWLVLLIAAVFVLPGAGIVVQGAAPVAEEQSVEVVNEDLSESDRLAEAALVDLGVRVLRDDNNEVYYVQIDGSQFRDEHVVHLRRLNWSNTPTTTPGYTLSFAFTSFTYAYPSLRMNGAQVTDAVIEQMRGVTDFSYLGLIDNEKINSASLKRLKGFSKLKRLNLRGTSVTDDGLTHLRELQELENLDLANTKVTDAGLKHLSALPKLNFVRLGDTRVTGQGLEHLKGVKNLSGVMLQRTRINDSGLEHLKDINHLDYINVGETNITDDGLKHFRNLANLRVLYLNETTVTDTGLAHIRGLGNLEALALQGTRTTDQGLTHLQRLIKLVSLDLSDTEITDTGLKHVIGLNNLKVLRLNDTNTSDAGLEHLAGLVGLLQLRLSGTEVTDDGLDHLKQLKSLKTLDLEGTFVSDDAVEKLHKALPMCEVTYDGGVLKPLAASLPSTGVTLVASKPATQETSAQVPQVPEHRTVQVALATIDNSRETEAIHALKELGARVTLDDAGHAIRVRLDGITDEEMKYIASLPYLNNLILARTPELSDNALQWLKGLEQLEQLFIYQGNFSEKGLASIKDLGLRNLKGITLMDIDVTNEVVGHLAALPGIVNLRFDSEKINDEALPHLESKRNLKSLHLLNSQISDIGLKRLKGLVAVESLNFSNTAVGDDGLQHLKGIGALTGISLAGTKVTNAGMESLKSLRKLNALSLHDTDINDQGLVHLREMPQLKHLWLGGTDVTNDGLKHLGSLTELRSLGLRETEIGDSGELQHLARLSKLNWLVLSDTNISDSDLVHLSKLKNLKRLELEGTDLSDEAVESLKESLPEDCQVLFP